MQEEQSRKVEIKQNNVLSNYIKELNDDVNLTVANLREKSLLCSSIWAKWLSYLFLEKENLQRIANAKQKQMKKNASTIKNNDSVLRMKSEDKLNANDEILQKLSVLTKQTQDNIDYIEHALNILQNFSFNIKNTADIMKMQMSN